MADQPQKQPKEKQPIILSLIPRGSPDHQRYLIANQYLQYWTGETWSEQYDDTKALVYHSSNEALTVMQRMLMTEHSHLPVKRYRAPIYIDLFSDAPISEHDLKQWLVKVTKLILDSPKHGNGPVAGTLGTCRIEYGELEELK